jgi:leucyl-tRNA synthetase
VETLILLMAPFTPHVCDEMWMRIGRRPFVVDRPWPAADAAVAREETVELAVQVNGKIRGRVSVAQGAPEDEVRRQALESVAEHVKDKEIAKVVVVPGRLVSVVVR